MGLYYVYMVWVRDGITGELGRQLLTCASRYAADELYREFENITGLWKFSYLKRITPQYWCYDAVNSPEFLITFIMRDKTLPLSIRSSVTTTRLWNTEERYWTVAPSIPGPDWVNNGTYFIRNIRQPEIYWFHSHNNRILASRQKKTKFRIRVIGTTDDDRRVLIRSDPIRISTDERRFPIRADSTDSRGNAEMFVTRGVDNKLTTKADTPGDWTFHNLLGMFGTSWEYQGNEGLEHVIWVEGGHFDDWELC